MCVVNYEFSVGLRMTMISQQSIYITILTQQLNQFTMRFLSPHSNLKPYNLPHLSYHSPIIYIFMFLVLLCTPALSLPISNTTQSMVATLEVITYQPLLFNLSFSQPISTLPKFQLLFNQVPIKYTGSSRMQTNSFIITGNTEGIVSPQNYNTEKYVVMFTQPLDISGVTLNLDSFQVRARRSRHPIQYVMQPISQKPSHFKYQNQVQWISYVSLTFCCLIYFLSYTTLIGRSAFNFLAIYAYITLQSPSFTSFDYHTAYYFLFDVYQIDRQGLTYKLLYLSAPYIFIAVTFVIGLLSRVLLRRLAQRSNICSYVYYYLSYKLFFITWHMMCIPIFGTMTYLLRQSTVKQNYFNDSKILTIVYVYIGIALQIMYIYMCYMATNPQIGQSYEKWLQYTRTGHYQLFEGIHLGIDAQSRVKRNYQFYFAVWRILLLMLCTATTNNLANVFLQFTLLLYFYLVKPFRYDFFNYFLLTIQTLITVFFFYRYIRNLYIGISEEISTSTDMKSFLLSNLIIVSVILALYLVLAVYELYHRIRVIRSSVKKWNKENKYALEEMFGNQRRKSRRKSMMPSQKNRQTRVNQTEQTHQNNQTQLMTKNMDTILQQQGKPSPNMPRIDMMNLKIQFKKDDHLIKKKNSGSSPNSPSSNKKSSPKYMKKSSLLQSLSLNMAQDAI